MRFLKIAAYAIGLVLLLLSCDMGIEVDDPFENEGIFEITVREYSHEIRIVGGRELVRVIVRDTTFTGENASLEHESGKMNIRLHSNEITSSLMAGVEGKDLLGLYDIIPFEEDMRLQQNKFAVVSERVVTSDSNGTNPETTTYYSEYGWLQVYMYYPGKRLRAGFNFRANVESSLDEGTQEELPDSVRIIGSFNAIF
jgi:hypothetical protein